MSAVRWVLAVVLVAACDDARPCSSCPPLEGRYALTYEGGATAGDCATARVGEPPRELEIARSGPTIRSTALGVELTGTLYDTFDFTLAGAGVSDAGSDAITYRGKFLPPSNATDGGTLLRGSYSGTHRPVPATENTCILERSFSGTKR